MEYLLQIFESLIHDATHARWLLSIVLGTATALFTLGTLYLLLNVTDPVRRRLFSVTGRNKKNGGSMQSLNDFMEPLSDYIVPTKEKEVSEIRSRLLHAGYRADNAVASYYTIKTLLAMMLAAATILAATFFPHLTSFQVALLALFAAFAGMMLPNYILAHQVTKRQRLLMNDFPDALDLLVACTEAGLGLNSALQRVANELAVSAPTLSEELALVNAQVRAGVDRVDALKDLANRTGLLDIRGLVSMLAQSLRFGVSIAETLRVYAEEFRDKRMQRAEEKAALVGTKMIFPLVFCMFPAFFVVAIGPAVIRVINVIQGLQ
jgi:tight adherence protein C